MIDKKASAVISDEIEEILSACLPRAQTRHGFLPVGTRFVADFALLFFAVSISITN